MKIFIHHNNGSIIKNKLIKMVDHQSLHFCLMLSLDLALALSLAMKVWPWPYELYALTLALRIMALTLRVKTIGALDRGA